MSPIVANRTLYSSLVTLDAGSTGFVAVKRMAILTEMAENHCRLERWMFDNDGQPFSCIVCTYTKCAVQVWSARKWLGKNPTSPTACYGQALVARSESDLQGINVLNRSPIDLDLDTTFTHTPRILPSACTWNKLFNSTQSPYTSWVAFIIHHHVQLCLSTENLTPLLVGRHDEIS